MSPAVRAVEVKRRFGGDEVGLHAAWGEARGEALDDALVVAQVFEGGGADEQVDGREGSLVEGVQVGDDEAGVEGAGRAGGRGGWPLGVVGDVDADVVAVEAGVGEGVESCAAAGAEVDDGDGSICEGWCEGVGEVGVKGPEEDPGGRGTGGGRKPPDGCGVGSDADGLGDLGVPGVAGGVVGHVGGDLGVRHGEVAVEEGRVGGFGRLAGGHGGWIVRRGAGR